jgi:ketosteroid isomerase-like protein
MAAVLCATGLLLLSVPIACSSSGGPGTPTPRGSPPSTTARSPAASPSGSTSAGTGAPTPVEELVSIYTGAAARLGEPGALDQLLTLYAADARVEDRALGQVCEGATKIRAYWQTWFGSSTFTYGAVATFVGRDCAAIESGATGMDMMLPTLEVLLLRNGRIATAYVYYYDGIAGRMPTALTTTPGSPDTGRASRRVARAYMATLRRLDAGGLASLYAGTVVYRDVAHEGRYAGVAAAVQAHEEMFAMKGVRFAAAGVLGGPGWAVVMWRRTDREGKQLPLQLPAVALRAAKRATIAGATLLEIRRDAIVRESIYCDHLRTRL